MALEPDECCCVCYEPMKDSDNLTFCKFQCGRNLHTECMERWVRHKISNSSKVTCPLCRTDWGKNALEELRDASKQHRENKKRLDMERKREEAKRLQAERKER